MSSNPQYAGVPGYDNNGFPIFSREGGTPNPQYAGMPGYDDEGYYVAKLLATAPSFGEVVVATSSTSKVFSFFANGSNERQKIVDLYQYFANELAMDRRVCAVAGVGDYGFDGEGITQLFQAGSRGLTFSGMGAEVTRFGFIGDTESGPNWRAMEWKSDSLAVKAVISVTQLNGVATVNITAHGAVVGETVRLYNSNMEEYNGLHFVTSITPDFFTFSVDAATISPATGSMTCAIHSEFIHDFSVGNMVFMDINPAAHANIGVEETHGLEIRFAKNFTAHKLWSSGIGDESVEVEYVEDFEITGFRSKDTPSQELTGGGAISIKAGCHNGLVDKFIIGNIGSSSANTYGVNFKNVTFPEESSDITVSNGIILNPVESGVQFNTGSSGMHDHKLINVTVIGGKTGVSTAGSSFVMSDIKMDNLTLRDQTVTPFSLARSETNCFDITLSNSLMDGRFLPDAQVSTCASVNGSRINLLDNTYKNSRSGVIGGSAVRNLKVLGGTMFNIGLAATPATTFNQYVYDQDPTRSGVVDGLTIADGKCGNVGFNGLKTIKGCDFVGTTVQPSGWTARDIDNFENNTNVPQNVRLDGDGGRGQNNEFTHTGSGGNGCIRLNGVSGVIISGNTSPNLVSGDGIEEAVGCTNNIITGNNMNGRPINIIGGNGTIATGGNL